MVRQYAAARGLVVFSFRAADASRRPLALCVVSVDEHPFWASISGVILGMFLESRERNQALRSGKRSQRRYLTKPAAMPLYFFKLLLLLSLGTALLQRDFTACKALKCSVIASLT